MGLLSSLLAGPSPPSSLPTLSLPLYSSSITHLLSLLSTGETTSTQRFDPMELVEVAEVLGVDMADLAIAVRDNMAVTKPATNTKDGHTNQTIPDKYGEEATKPGNLPSNLSSNDGVEEAININVVKEESYGDDANDEKLMT